MCRQLGFALLAVLVGLAPVGAAAHRAAAAAHRQRAAHACGLAHAHADAAPHPADCPLCALASRRAPVATALPFTIGDTRCHRLPGLRPRPAAQRPAERPRGRSPPASPLA
ncbi:MAG: hypothetical protein D6776_05390 [Planctomycetota bacterium]|nr:MAG: hypothetical protein D6776_05390 [Planctomycetota bacterium]